MIYGCSLFTIKFIDSLNEFANCCKVIWSNRNCKQVVGRGGMANTKKQCLVYRHYSTAWKIIFYQTFRGLENRLRVANVCSGFSACPRVEVVSPYFTLEYCGNFLCFYPAQFIASSADNKHLSLHFECGVKLN